MFLKIAQWQQSGLSQKAWCEQESMSYNTFHYWYRRFRRDRLSDNMDAQPNFVQVKVDGQLSGIPWCELVLNDGHRIIFHQPVSATLISSLLA